MQSAPGEFVALTVPLRILPGVLALAGVFFCGPALAETPNAVEAEPADAKEWLRSMREAGTRLNFQGIAAYWQHGHLRTLRIRHEVVNGQVREHVEALDNTAGEDPAPASTVTAETPEAAERALGDHPPLLGDWPLDLTRAERYYRFAIGREGRIAGRNTREIVIAPLDDERYGRRLWIDRKSRLPLKYEIIATGGRVLEQFVYAELNISASPGNAEGTASSVPPPVAHALEQQAIDSLAWRLDNVPRGYRIVAYARHNAPDTPVIEHLLLGDGFSSISLYIEETSRSFPHDERIRHFGAMRAFSRRAGHYRVTVIAEAPAKTVIGIAKGVRRGGQ